ncbi:MAG TPA: DUF4386 domain-containing protein [Chitinophagaceae bacterium]|nr:DUF4386 domain-containing protein [Chitinophagaceae bacterium]
MPIIHLPSDTRGHRIHARLAGILFIAAAATSIIALKLVDPVLRHPVDLQGGAYHGRQILCGALLELVLTGCVAGTGMLLYPYLRKWNEPLALGYLCFRVLEACVILVGLLGVLALLRIGQAFLATNPADAASYQAVAEGFHAMQEGTFLLGHHFMLGMNTLCGSAIFYRSGLVPRRLSRLGITGACLIILAAVLEISGIVRPLSLAGALLATPVFFYQMSLATWLMVTGFNTDALADAPG